MAPGAPATRLSADCEAGTPICLGCGNVFIGRTTQRPEYSIGTCMNKRGQGTARGTCGHHQLFVGMPGGLVRVIELRAVEFQALLGTPHPLHVALREMGMLRGRR